MIHLHDAVQTDLKKLLRNPPLVNTPKITDLINQNALMKALHPSVHGPLEGSTKETSKLRGATLYKEGSKSSGIWLISTGVVKWASRSIKNKHSLHPTFTHGSTLGLYEVLSGKTYICDIITDSVVVCFFIESQKIRSMLDSDPSVEDILWQESAIMLLKLLLPQKFEKMAMQDLRVLVGERSTMTIYIRGEFFEIPNHSFGILLEGFVKTEGIREELITSPAPLLASHGYQSFQNLENFGTTGARTSFSRAGASFSHKGSTYHVETRSRVIVFDMTALESVSPLIKRPSSFLSHAADHPLRSLSREHTGLMSWPEQFFKPKQQKQSPEWNQQRANSLSTRAMHLSRYSSVVNVRPQTRSMPRSAPTQPSHTVSYPNVLLHGSRPLVSVRSEGPSTVRKNLEVRNFAGKSSPPGQSTTDPIKTHMVVEDDSSDDESGGEDDVIIRIDSPSRLSFQQANFTP